MTFFYSNSERSGDFSIGLIQRLDPNKCYNKHMENYFFLRFIEKSSDKFNERADATRELVICEKKLKYWSRDSRFDQKMSERDTADLRNKWSSK